MKNNIIIICIAAFCIISCNSTSILENEFNCKSNDYNNLEEVPDLKNLFSVKIPEDWNINLYKDEIQSSIFAADTTKQLTESILVDVTFVEKEIEFSEVFKLEQEQENLAKGLLRIKHNEVSFKEKKAYYTLSKGKKGNYNYQIFKKFIKVNPQNFIMMKIEIYGDSLVNNRFCNALTLVDNIKIVY